MPLSNRAPVNAAGQIMVTTTTPTADWPSLGGMTYHPTTGELAVLDAVPAATDPWVGGIRFTNLGSMYVTTVAPSPIFYVGGLPVSTDGRLFMSSGPPVGSVGGWPVSGDGGISGSGLAPVPIFFAPLTHSLVPTTAGNPTFTFTRATLGYVTDFEGVLRQAIANEARFTGARRVQNTVRTTITSWTPVGTGSVSGGITDPLGGATAYQVNMPADFDGIREPLASLAAGTGVGSIWLRADAPGTVTILSNNAFQLPLTTFNVTTVWQRFASTPATGAADSSFYIRRTGTTLTKVYAWQAQLESVSGQSNQAPSEYVSVGVLAAPYHGNAIDGVRCFVTTNNNSVAANVVTEAPGTPIPLATTLGYLAESAATNLCLQSQTFDNVAWTKTNFTPLADNIAAPDGTLTADRFTDDATSGTHRVFRADLSFTLGTVYTYSIYLKQGTLPWAQIHNYDGTFFWANINLATGAVGNKSAGVTVAVAALPNGWYRVSITFTASATVVSAGYASAQGISTDQNAPNPAYIGTGQTMYLWGAQVEAGDMSSYIPTTTVATVRNIDQLEYPTATNIGSSVGTVYSEAYLPPSSATNRILFRWDAADVLQYITGGKLSYITPAFGGPIQTVNSFVPSTVNKCATAYSASTGVGCLNGGTTINGAFVATLPAATNFRLGGGAGENAQGTIRNVKVYATRLTDAELIALTA